jgi:adenine specific DNA methylase Mod
MTNLLYRGDCKQVMQSLIDKGERVDLVYLDPPFNSSRIYNIIFNSGGVSAQQKAFHDMWNFPARAQQLSLEFIQMIKGLEDIPSLLRILSKLG